MKFKSVLIFSGLGVIIGLLIYYFYPYSKIPTNVIIDKIVVVKSRRKLFAYSNNLLIKTYTIAIGKNSKGDKQYEGDEKTPEGEYFINSKNPNSLFHKNLCISYPDAQDLRDAIKFGRPAGGDIKIHGLKNGQRYIGHFQSWVDWTNGCIALTNEELDDLYYHTPVGTPIIIKP